MDSRQKLFSFPELRGLHDGSIIPEDSSPETKVRHCVRGGVGGRGCTPQRVSISPPKSVQDEGWVSHGNDVNRDVYNADEVIVT